MRSNSTMHLWKWYAALAIVFAAVVSFNFTKPFGFFRESNPALVAINAKYWEQNADVKEHHIPVASYAFDKTQPPATQFDNTITTFGYAWFSVPYYFFRWTNIPVSPVGLRIFSIIWLLFTLSAVYLLAKQLSRQYAHERWILLATVVLYAFSPVVLWYQVNGYVHETAVLPFYYFGWYFFLKLLDEKKNKWLWLTGITVFIGIQFDWLSFFQGIVMSGYLLFSRKDKPSRWTFFIPGLFIVLGMAYIIYTYTSWASINDYFAFMKWKFSSRTVGQEGHSFLSFWPVKLNIILFYIIGYGALLLLCVFGLIKKKLHPLLWLMIITVVLHHIVFWGFSSEHDYAALKMAFPLGFIAAVYLAGIKKKTAIILTGMIVCLAVTQYFVLHNYPFRKGMYEDEQFFVKAGDQAKAQPADAVVFINTENKYFPQVEFYAGRPYRMATSAEEARQQMLSMGITKAVFIDITANRTVVLKN